MREKLTFALFAGFALTAAAAADSDSTINRSRRFSIS